MANLDTRTKRSSSVMVWLPFRTTLVLPDGTIGTADRQQTAYGYGGLTLAAPVVATPVSLAPQTWSKTQPDDQEWTKTQPVSQRWTKAQPADQIWSTT